MSAPRSLPLALFVILAAVASGCSSDRLQQLGCRVDADCATSTVGAESFRCEPANGVCYCRDDAACPRAEFCNAVGFCQPRTGCTTNQDCLGSGLYCDTSVGSCVPEGRCTSDLHCRIGQVCDLSRELCVDGCRTAGDCNGTSCRCGDGQACGCDALTPEGLAACEIGTCDPSFCQDETFCRFGEKCDVPEAAPAGSDAQCFSDYDPNRRPYCAACTWGPGVDECGRGGNFCLVDTRNRGNSYCGVDCTENPVCPRGYACQDVIVVSRKWTCTTPGVCGANANSPSCTTQEQCPGGSTCVNPTGAADAGSCVGSCRVDEGDSLSFCSCVVDQDCAQDHCESATCSISGKGCLSDADCRPVQCIEFEGSRGCFIGQNCAPANGLTCNDVL